MGDVATEKRDSAPSGGGSLLSLGTDSPAFWLLLAGSGVPLCWLVMGATFATGTWVAGGVPGGWPSLAQLWNVGWMLAADGARLDEAWLVVSNTSAVAAAAWLWLLAAAYTTGIALTATTFHNWREAGWPTASVMDLLPVGGGPLKDFRRREWPVHPPYSPMVPGPGVLLGRDRRQHIVAAGGRPVMVFGPTGSGKTRHVIAPNTGHWPGPVVATSVKTDLAEWTLAHRREKGTCYGYDPTGRMWPWMREVGIVPVVWDPVRLLKKVTPDQRRETATVLAQFLTSQSSSHDAGSQGIWATLAQQYLTEVLVITAEVDFTLTSALNWMLDIKGIGKDDTLPAAKLGVEGNRSLRRLKNLANKDDRFQGSVEITLKEVTGALEHTAANKDVDLVPADLTTSGESDTLYLVADHLSQTTHKPVFAAVTRYLFHVTETHQPNPDKRPPRPLFALDELANLARLADLPSVLSTIRSRAQVICGIQERSQLDAGWGQANSKTLVGNCPVKLQLPGSSDASALRDWATLAGGDSDDSDTDRAASWRTIPKGHARVIADEHPAFEVEMADPDRWLADTPPTAAEKEPPTEDDTDQDRPFDSPDPTSSVDTPAVALAAPGEDEPAPPWQQAQEAGLAAADRAYAEAAGGPDSGTDQAPDRPDPVQEAIVTDLDDRRDRRVPNGTAQPTGVSAGNAGAEPSNHRSDGHRPGGNGHAPPHPFGPVTRLTVTPAETAPSEIAALAAAAEARLTAAKPRIERFLITMQYRTRHAKRNPTRPRHRHTAPTRPWDTTRGTKTNRPWLYRDGPVLDRLPNRVGPPGGLRTETAPARWLGPSGRGYLPRRGTPRLSDADHPIVKYLLS